MFFHRCWCEFCAMNKVPLLPVSLLLVTGVCLSLFGSPEVQSTALCCGMVACFACGFVHREVKLTRSCFWLLLPAVCGMIVAYNLLCFGTHLWEQSSCLG